MSKDNCNEKKDKALRKEDALKSVTGGCDGPKGTNPSVPNQNQERLPHEGDTNIPLHPEDNGPPPPPRNILDRFLHPHGKRK